MATKKTAAATQKMIDVDAELDFEIVPKAEMLARLNNQIEGLLKDGEALKVQMKQAKVTQNAALIASTQQQASEKNATLQALYAQIAELENE